MLRRRLLAIAPCLLVPRLAGAGTARFGFTPLPGERVAFHVAGIAGAIVLPIARVRVLATPQLANREVALLGFAADTETTTADLLAVAAWDGSGLRIVAIDVLNWRATDGAHLTSRVTASLVLTLARTAAAPRGALMWRRESWTDYLAWHDDTTLADQPVRQPLAGTWQHSLAIWRLAMLERLGPGCRDATLLGVPPDFRVG